MTKKTGDPSHAPPEGVLSGHRQHKSKISSTLLTGLNWNFVSYVDDIIPELVLLGLINQSVGYRQGVDLIWQLARSLDEVSQEAAPICSSIAKIGESGMQTIRHGLAEQLDVIVTSFAPFTTVFPAHPVALLGTNRMSTTEAVSRLSQCVESLLDRHTVTACAMMASLYYVQARRGRLHINADMKQPNLDAIITDFESDQGQHAAASVRMFAQLFVGQFHSTDASWPEEFWHRCYEISECELWNFENE